MGELNFSNSLGKLGTDAFTDALYEDPESQAFDFPLEKFCEMGGWADRADSVEFDIKEAGEQGDPVVVKTEVWFTERAPGGCPDIPNHESRHGTLIIEIDRRTGQADVTTERDEIRRNLEYY